MTRGAPVGLVMRPPPCWPLLAILPLLGPRAAHAVAAARGPGAVAAASPRAPGPRAAGPASLRAATISALQGLARREPGALHRLVLPSSKLAFCYIPKVASKQMVQLFGAVNGVGGDFVSSTAFLQNTSWSDVRADRGWKFATFLRDPLERYLSTWLSKCAANASGVVEDNGGNCHGSLFTSHADSEAKVRAFEERVFLDALRGWPHHDPHWDSQYKILRGCGWERFDPKASCDFVGRLTKDLHGQVLGMLRMVNSTVGEALVSKFFPEGSIAGHRTSAASQMALFYRKPLTASAVVSLYGEDYAHLPLPMPDVRHLGGQAPPR